MGNKSVGSSVVDPDHLGLSEKAKIILRLVLYFLVVQVQLLKAVPGNWKSTKVNPLNGVLFLQGFNVSVQQLCCFAFVR